MKYSVKKKTYALVSVLVLLFTLLTGATMFGNIARADDLSDNSLPNVLVGDYFHYASTYDNHFEEADMISGFFVQPLAAMTNVNYSAHVAHRGWLPQVSNGAVAGTTGLGLGMEAFRINLTNQSALGGIRYRAHVAHVGWQGWVANNAIAGTTGQGRAIEALQIELTGAIANQYHIEYRVHVAHLGWLNWVRNGATAGTTGQGRAIEAVEIRLVRGTHGLVTVTFNANGGTLTNPSRQYNAHTLFGALPIPTRANRAFVGWFANTQPILSVRLHSVNVVPNHNVTYFARWNDPNRHQNRWWPHSGSNETTAIPFRFTNTTQTNNWLSQMRRGVNYWNSNTVPVRFFESTSSANTLAVINYSGPSYGRISIPGGSGGTMTSFTGTLHENNIRASATNLNNFITSVAAHELGHVVGIRDNPVGVAANNSIMNHARNRNIVVRPTSFDEEGVRMLYQ